MAAFISLGALAAADPGIKQYVSGTHRTVPPAASLARLRPLLPAMGITRVANVTGLDRIGVPVVMVCRPNARSIAVSQGKGLTLEAAKVSGIMEAAEVFHAERIERPLRLGSQRDLAGAVPLVDVDGLPRGPDSRWHPDLQMLWIEAIDLVADGSAWVPYEVVHANYTHPPPTGSGCFAASTNGLASGNHPLEAISHAICEIIERDATALWNLLPTAARAATRIDLATVADPACRSVIERLERAGLAVAAWESTSDIGVPACECVIANERHPLGHAGGGAGCHPTAEIALLRALTEAVQVRNTYVSGSRDDLLAEEYTAAGQAEKLRRVRRLMGSSAPQRDFRALASHRFDSFAEECRWLLERLTAAGCGQVLAVDLSKAELGLPVARVVIPGLEGFDATSLLPGARARAAAKSS